MKLLFSFLLLALYSLYFEHTIFPLTRCVIFDSLASICGDSTLEAVVEKATERVFEEVVDQIFENLADQVLGEDVGRVNV